ncbi:zinc carboxypeptidase-like [Copidosoma floridanum]|uniref:zinc carboxypeptidase-like n=1 Tax=Copidosoma floridanum TaxID=29053 RepID=UPI000C6F92A4|nr:zinc carboxypeptidase-like [Copidosoma floridanum]
MLRAAAIFALVALVAAEQASYENFKVLRITPRNNRKLELIGELENHENSLEFWRGPSYVDHPVDLMVPPSKGPQITEYLDVHELEHEVYIDNVQSLIDGEKLRSIGRYSTASGYDFESYKTIEEIHAYLAHLADKHPDKVEPIVAGKSYEGRELRGVMISHGPNRSAIFIEAGIHAREWVTPATATYIANALLNSQDPDVRGLAEAYDWYIVPSVNPDGYVYTHEYDRLWRKTRSGKSDFCKGVDANRNWDYKWMVAGASSQACAETYAGKRPFSEIEMKTLSEYLKSVSHRVFAYISFHSYSQLLLFPYGHTTAHLENYDELYAISAKAVNSLSRRYGTKYSYGNIAETIYKASGSSIDYAKGALKIPLAFTYEFRDKGRHGFLLPADQIVPNSEEVLDSLVAMFNEAKKIGYPKP